MIRQRKAKKFKSANKSKQLAMALRTEAWVETDPARKSLFEQAADALEHKLPRGPKTNPHLQRQEDIELVERVHQLRKELGQSGSKNPATQAYEQIAVELGLGDGESARRTYQRALKRSQLGPTET
jgi:hypothetical protein